jgi:hypothetical protein
LVTITTFGFKHLLVKITITPHRTITENVGIGSYNDFRQNAQSGYSAFLTLPAVEALGTSIYSQLLLMR